jgi:hypothetical protein
MLALIHSLANLAFACFAIVKAFSLYSVFAQMFTSQRPHSCAKLSKYSSRLEKSSGWLRWVCASRIVGYKKE